MPKIQVKCEKCGKTILRYKCEIREHVFCSTGCSRSFLSRRMTVINQQLNPSRMTDQTREKLRESHLNSGEGKTYSKVYGRHEHRVVAEQMLNRPLKKGEVVHHIDKNRRNNSIENLIIFPSQKDHAFWHKIEEEILLDFREV